MDDSIDPIVGIRRAAVVLVCRELEPNLAFFTGELGFRLESIFPADQPAVALLEGFGVRLWLELGPEDGGGTLRLTCDVPGAERVAPNGVRVLLVPDEREVSVPALVASFTVTRAEAAAWHDGRAGMRYRDLVPDRQGGWLIASHIAIPRGGPVPDYVHFHGVRFQMIFCYRGWVTVVYEDQGAPITMEAGDCVLQPPGIRHRVLECSDGLEVVELGVPAQHPTFADPGLELPNAELRPERYFDGQRFLFDRAELARWQPRDASFEARDVGMAAATGGLARVQVLRVRPAREQAAGPAALASDADLRFLFVLEGQLTLRRPGESPASLATGDAATLPPGQDVELAPGAGCELLQVALSPTP